MAFFDKEIDITRNIKIIEWLKSELLEDVSSLFKILINGMRRRFMIRFQRPSQTLY